MKTETLLMMFVALLCAPIAGAHSYRYADNSPDPDLAPRIKTQAEEQAKIEEQELRRLLIEVLEHERQSYATREELIYQDDQVDSDDEMIYEDDQTDSDEETDGEIKEMPWWAWIIVGGVGVTILGKFAK